MLRGAALLLACLTAQAQSVRPTLDLPSVTIEVTWVSSPAEMKRLRREHGQPPLEDPVFRSRLSGFSVLGKRDGQHVCLIFVERPEKVDDRNTTTLGHEVAHCLLGSYH